MGQVNITLNTRKVRGRLAREITVRSDDPERPTVRLRLQAEVAVGVRLHPQVLGLGNSPRARSVAWLRVRQDPAAEGVLKIEDLDTGADWLAASSRRLDSPESLPDGQVAEAGDWLVKLELDPEAPWGAGRYTLRFNTGLAREPTVEVPVAVNRIPPVTVQPNPLVLRPDGERRPAAEVLAVVRRERRHESLAVEARPAVVAVKVERTGDRHYRVVVSCPAAPSDTIEGELVFEVRGERVRVPLRVESGAS